MIEIFFIRHGQASFGAPSYDCLSVLGEQQAALLGRAFAAHGTAFDAIYCGSMKRHRQTAAIALSQMNGQQLPEMVIDAGFNEFEGSDGLMGQLAELIRRDPGLQEEMAGFHTDHKAVGRLFDLADKAGLLPADETVRQRHATQFRQRICRAVDNLVKREGPDRKVALFTSGGPTTVALGQALQTSRELTRRLGHELRNTSVTVLRHEGNGLKLVLFNSVAHLEVRKDPQLLTYL